MGIGWLLGGGNCGWFAITAGSVCLAEFQLMSKEWKSADRLVIWLPMPQTSSTPDNKPTLTNKKNPQARFPVDVAVYDPHVPSDLSRMRVVRANGGVAESDCGGARISIQSGPLCILLVPSSIVSSANKPIKDQLTPNSVVKYHTTSISLSKPNNSQFDGSDRHDAPSMSTYPIIKSPTSSFSQPSSSYNYYHYP